MISKTKIDFDPSVPEPHLVSNAAIPAPSITINVLEASSTPNSGTSSTIITDLLSTPELLASGDVTPTSPYLTEKDYLKVPSSEYPTPSLIDSKSSLSFKPIKSVSETLPPQKEIIVSAYDFADKLVNRIDYKSDLHNQSDKSETSVIFRSRSDGYLADDSFKTAENSNSFSGTNLKMWSSESIIPTTNSVSSKLRQSISLASLYSENHSIEYRKNQDTNNKNEKEIVNPQHESRPRNKEMHRLSFIDAAKLTGGKRIAADEHKLENRCSQTSHDTTSAPPLMSESYTSQFDSKSIEAGTAIKENRKNFQDLSSQYGPPKSRPSIRHSGKTRRRSSLRISIHKKNSTNLDDCNAISKMVVHNLCESASKTTKKTANVVAPLLWNVSGKSNSTISYKNDKEMTQFIDLCVNSNWDEALQMLEENADPEKLLHAKHYITKFTPLMLAAREGELEMVKMLLDKGASVDAKDHEGSTALFYGIWSQNLDVVQELVTRGASLDIVGGDRKLYPIHVAASVSQNEGEIIQYLISQIEGEETKYLTDIEGWTPLFYAVSSGILDNIKVLLKEEPEIQLQQKDFVCSDTPLIQACRTQNLEVLEYLLQKGAPVNDQNMLGETALHVAAEFGNVDMTKLLYEYKAQTNILDEKDRSPLQIAIEHGHLHLLSYFVKTLRCDVTKRDKQGRTLLHMAAADERISDDIIHAYLKYGVPIHMPDKNGDTCLHTAAKVGNKNVVKILLQTDIDINQRNNANFTSLHLAVMNFHPTVAEMLIGAGAHIDPFGGQENETPLLIAVSQNGGYECARVLLSSGADLTALKRNGDSAIHLATASDNIGIINDLFLESIQMIYHRSNIDGDSPLHAAVRHCHKNAVSKILDYIRTVKGQAEVAQIVNLENNEGNTCLHVVAGLDKSMCHYKQENVEILRLLLINHGDIMKRNKKLETPFHISTRIGDPHIFCEFLTHLQSTKQINEAINCKTITGRTPLHYASEGNKYKTVELLLLNNGRVDAFDNEGYTAVHVSAQYGNCDTLDMLFQNNAFINSRTTSGHTPLHLACQNGHYAAVSMLVKRFKASVNTTSLRLETPLHLSAEHGYSEIVRLLLFNKFDPAYAAPKNICQQTPLHLAVMGNHAEIIECYDKGRKFCLFTPYFDENDMTIAHIAAKNGSIKVIKAMTNLGATILFNQKNMNGSTPMHMAAEGGHVDIVKVFLSTGIQPIQEDNDGNTPMHLAAKNGHINMLMELQKYMSLNIASKISGWTPIHSAAYHGQVELIQKMIQMGINITLCTDMPNKSVYDDYKLNCLHLAAMRGYEEVIRLLINTHSFDVHAKSEPSGNTCGYYAAMYGHTNVIYLLVSKYGNIVEMTNNLGETMLHAAAEHGQDSLIALLISQGADLEARDNENCTPLHYAAVSGHLECVRTLINAGANLDAETGDHKTALMLAVQFHNGHIVQFLLENGLTVENYIHDLSFLYDLTLCCKSRNSYELLNNCITLSDIPIVTAADLYRRLRQLASFHKVSYHEFRRAAHHCEMVCIELFREACDEYDIETILTAVNKSETPLLDTIIRNEMKILIAQPSIQEYMAKLWWGDLIGYNRMQYITMFIITFNPFFPFLFLNSFCAKVQSSPAIKSFSYMFSHLFHMTLLYLTVLTPIKEMTETYAVVIEWLLFISTTGTILNEFINFKNYGRNVLRYFRIFTIVFSVLGVITYIIAGFVHFTIAKHAYYVSLQLFAGGCFCAWINIIDYLKMHHFFGIFSAVMVDIIEEWFRFLIIVSVYVFGFMVFIKVNFQQLYAKVEDAPLYDRDKESFITIFSALVFSMFGFDYKKLPFPIRSHGISPAICTIAYGMYVLLTGILIINVFIALLQDIYRNTNEMMDTEWKLERAKLILAVVKTSPVPPPANLFINLALDLKEIYRLTISRTYEMPRSEQLLHVVDWEIICSRLNLSKLNMKYYSG